MSARKTKPATKSAAMSLIEARTAALSAAIDAWRDRYASDLSVTQYTIAAAVGASQPTVAKYMRRLGWPEQSRSMGVKRCLHARFGEHVKKAPKMPAPPPPPPAVASSIWCLAAGRLVSTTRRGGKHIEVRA